MLPYVNWGIYTVQLINQVFRNDGMSALCALIVYSDWRSINHLLTYFIHAASHLQKLSTDLHIVLFSNDLQSGHLNVLKLPLVFRNLQMGRCPGGTFQVDRVLDYVAARSPRLNCIWQCWPSQCCITLATCRPTCVLSFERRNYFPVNHYNFHEIWQ